VHASRITDVYKNGVEEFLQFAQRNATLVNGKYYCPCVNCLNVRRQSIELIREHLLYDSFLKSYRTWTWHGEVVNLSSIPQSEESNVYHEDRMEDMIDDIGEDNFKNAQVYDSLKDDSEKSLYPGCTRFTRLSAILKLFNIKARNGWTDRSFTELLELLHEMLQEGNM